MRIRPRNGLVLAILSCGVCWGCGPAGERPQARLIAAKGKVTYKGQPLTKGRVTFEPDGYGRPAEGQIQSDGSFVLGTNKDGDGVVAGHHQVTITGTGNRPGQELVPKKYTDRMTSKVTADVDAEHTEFTFDLK